MFTMEVPVGRCADRQTATQKEGEISPETLTQADENKQDCLPMEYCNLVKKDGQGIESESGEGDLCDMGRHKLASSSVKPLSGKVTNQCLPGMDANLVQIKASKSEVGSLMLILTEIRFLLNSVFLQFTVKRKYIEINSNL